MKKLLLIGGAGFVGSQMSASLGTDFTIASHDRDYDVKNAEQMKKLITLEKPDLVVLLAAVSTIAESFSKPFETYEVNFQGTLNVLMALRECDFHGRMLYVSSSEVYGLLSEHELPVSESRPLRPLSPYAVSKIASEAICYQWSQTENFEIVLARPFNHIGPGQSERFAIANFARQIAAIKLGLSEPIIYVGDIDTTRDFTDVRDIVLAYRSLLMGGNNGEVYNVCSGVERSIRFLIERMCDLAGVFVELRIDTARLRASEQLRVFGSYSKLFADTGWNPSIALDQTLSDIVNSWVVRLSGDAECKRKPVK
jgi:GDP-4-dehydro-6-deoxy-D-mannose reductase